jgi:hypothetical protein
MAAARRHREGDGGRPVGVPAGRRAPFMARTASTGAVGMSETMEATFIGG